MALRKSALGQQSSRRRQHNRLCSTSPFYLVGTVASGSFLENSHNRDRRLARRATMRGFKVRAPNSQLARKIYYEAKR